jgi:hypothetical protein
MKIGQVGPAKTGGFPMKTVRIVSFLNLPKGHSRSSATIGSYVPNSKKKGWERAVWGENDI